MQREDMAQASEKKRLNILRNELAWVQRGARARSTKQKARLQRFEELKNVKGPVTDGKVELASAASRLGRTTVEIENVSKSYGDKVLIRDFTYLFGKDDRVGFIGPNGSGKTTLMKMILGEVTPDSGHIEIGQYYNIFLDLYPFKVQSILRKGDMGEYVKYTRQYLETYEKFRQENHRALVGVMELQDRLRNVTLDRENMQASNRVLEDLAMHDELTGLANRTYLHEYLTGCFEHAYAEEKLLGVELMDIDFFKEYNDHYGHLMGDRCLKAIAGVLQKIQIPGQVFCARYGGDEFMIVYTGMTVEQIRRISEDILREVRMLKIPHECSRCSKYVSISQGVFARIPMENNREWDFTSRADELLYKAKNCGREGICLSTEKSGDKCIEIK